MRKTTLSRSLLLTAALTLGGNIQAQEQQQVLYYDEAAPVTSIEGLVDGDYVLDIHNTSGENNATGLVYYHQEGNDNQRRYRAIYNFSFDGGIITDERYIWTLTWNTERTAFSLQNKDGAYMCVTTSQQNYGRGDMVTNDDEANIAWYAPEVSDEENRFFLRLDGHVVAEGAPNNTAGQPLYLMTNNAGSGYKNLSYWNCTAPAQNEGPVRMQFLPVSTGVTASITYKYNVTDLGISFTQTAPQQVIGTAYQAPTVNFYTITEQPQGTVTGEEEMPIEVNCTTNYPGFAASTMTTPGTFNSDTHWYTLSVRGGQAVVATESDIRSKNQTRQLKKGNLWTFVKEDGSPDLFKVYNLLKGADAPLSIAGTTNSTAATFGTIEGDAATSTFRIIANGNGFTLQHPENNTACLGDHVSGGVFGLWTNGSSPTDAGSRLTVSEVNDLVETLVETSTSYVGGVKEGTSTYNALKNAYDGFNEMNNITENLTTLCNFDLSTAPDEDRIALADGGYYRLHCAPVRGNYVLSVDAENMGLKSAAPSTSDASQIWKAVRTGDGKYKLMAQGYAIGGDNSLSLVDDAEAATFYFGKNLTGDSNGDPNLIWFFDTTNSESSNSGNTALNVDQSLNITLLPNRYGASAWLVEEVKTLDVAMNQVDNETWATLYLPFSVKVPEGVTAYTGTQKDENTVGLTDVENGIVPARTGVVLKGTETACQLALTNDAVAPIENNVFTGTCLPISVTPETLENYYVLSTLNGVIGLYWPMESTTELAANKAFIEKSEAAGATGYRFIFGDDTTVGIGDAVLGQPADAPYYDLTGRRVAQPVKGIYIHNGKKVFVK